MEQDQRLSLLNSLLTTPHRELTKLQSVHSNIITNDPILYKHLACWYEKNGEVKDHKELFVANLCLNNVKNRDIGLALLNKLPPYQVRRVVDFIRKDLNKNIPRSLRTTIQKYLRNRENDEAWFSSSVLSARKHLKRLYALLKIKPSSLAQDVLFDNVYPENTIIYTMRVLAKTDNPTEQAKIIMQNKLPYRLVSSVVKKMTPPVIFSLVKSMSDAELVNNLSSLKRRGAFNNNEIKTFILERLEKAKDSKNLATLKSLKAVKSKNLEEVSSELMSISEAQTKYKGKITRPTALLIDKSASMRESIEIGKQLGTMIGSVCETDFYCYAFDSIAYNIRPEDSASFESWNKEFEDIKPSGRTSCGVGIYKLSVENQKVEQIIMVTDEGECASPRFLTSLNEYSDKFEKPDLVMIRCGSSRHRILTDMAIRNGYNVDEWEFDGDYYSLPNLLTFLTRKSKVDLLMEIMSYPLLSTK